MGSPESHVACYRSSLLLSWIPVNGVSIPRTRHELAVAIDYLRIGWGTRLMNRYKDMLDSAAKKIADQSGVDIARTRSILGRCLRTYEGRVISEEAEYDPEESKSILFFTELMLAGRYLGTEKTLDLFEQADLDDLVRKQIFAIHWSRRDPFLYTPGDLAERWTAVHSLLVRNREHLLKTGYPQLIAIGESNLEASPKWWGLMRLYPTKAPKATSTSADDHGNICCCYTWCDDCNPAHDAYETAPRFTWLPEEGAVFLKAMRPRVLRLGTAVAQIMKEAVLLPTKVSLWEVCREAFLDDDVPAAERLTADEVDLLLRVDAVYALREPEMRNADPLDEPTIFDCFHQILLMIGLSDWVRTSEQPRAIRETLERGGLIEKTPMATPLIRVRSYYPIVGTPAQEAFDEAVAIFESAPMACEQFRDDHMKRVNDFLGKEVPVRVGAWMLAPPQHAVVTRAILESVCEGQATSLKLFDHPAPTRVVFGDRAGDEESAREDSAVTAGRAAFVRKLEGSWEIVFEGKAIHPRDSLGLRYLAELLRRPYKLIEVAELSAAIRGQPVNDDAGMNSGDVPCEDSRPREHGDFDVEEIADRKTIEDIKRRIKELGEQSERAERLGELDRAQALDCERGKLEAYLTSASGLGGRQRRFSTRDEKVRKSVTAAINSAKKKIRESHPVLGEHLDVSVRTGTICSYEPRAHVPWEVS